MKKKSCFSIKVTELIKYANISRSTFYIYFDSMFDLIQEMEDTFLAGLPDTKNDRLFNKKEIAECLIFELNYAKKNMYMLQSFLGPYGDPSFQQKIKNYFIMSYEKELKKIIRYTSDVEKELFFKYNSGGRWQIYWWWIFNDCKISIEDMYRVIMKIIGQFIIK